MVIRWERKREDRTSRVATDDTCSYSRVSSPTTDNPIDFMGVFLFLFFSFFILSFSDVALLRSFRIIFTVYRRISWEMKRIKLHASIANVRCLSLAESSWFTVVTKIYSCRLWAIFHRCWSNEVLLIPGILIVKNFVTCITERKLAIVRMLLRLTIITIITKPWGNNSTLKTCFLHRNYEDLLWRNNRIPRIQVIYCQLINAVYII